MKANSLHPRSAMCINSILRFIELGTCLFCGRMSISDKGVCKLCDGKICPKQEGLLKSRVENIPVLAIYEWAPGKSDAFSQWILSLKRAPLRKWRALAEEFVLQGVAELPRQSNLCLVPAPAREPSRRHAQLWAQALQQVGHWQTLDILSIKQSDNGMRLGPQKKRRRKERKEVAFIVSEKITTLSKSTTEIPSFVFVDDIVTTGSTALAAWQGLGRPENFQVWCVANRPSLMSTKKF